MKVLYDHQIFDIQTHGGISRYFANLYEGLNRKSDFHSELAVLHSRNHYIDNKPYLPSSAGKFLLKKQSNRNKWNKRYSEFVIRKNAFDVFHPTYYDPYFLDKVKKPFVLTVHDLIHELLPEYFTPYDPTVQFKRKVIERASHLIAISDSTKIDLQSVYNVADNKISVIHHGYQILTAIESELELPFTNYILFVGDRTKYKNFYILSSAVARLTKNYPELILVCAGGGAFTVVEQEAFLRKRLKNVYQIPANDGELKALYKNALAFVYPSLYEGFGLPILEAFANDCPAILSDIPPFKEIAGDACTYFDPHDVENMTEAIEKVINSESLADSLRKRGAIQLRKFPISDCIDKTATVYKLFS